MAEFDFTLWHGSKIANVVSKIYDRNPRVEILAAAAAQLADIRGNIGIGIWNFQREVRAGLRALFSRAIIASFATWKATEWRWWAREKGRFPRYSRRER